MEYGRARAGQKTGPMTRIRFRPRAFNIPYHRNDESDSRMAKSPDRKAGKAAGKTPEVTQGTASTDGRLWVLENRRRRLISRRRFAQRMGFAIGLSGVLMLCGLAIGMLGYAHFENLSWTDAYLNAAMILSGMGPVHDIKTEAGKIFAGSYAIFSGFIIIIATGVILAPVFHRVLHRFHMEESGKD